MTTTKKPRARRVVTPPPPAAPPSRPTTAEDLRIQVAATQEQADHLKDAADHAGYANARATGGRSAWMLKVSLAAADAELTGDVVVLAGSAAKIVKAEAEREGLTVEAYLEKAITMVRAVRAAAAMPAPAVTA